MSEGSIKQDVINNVLEKSLQTPNNSEVNIKNCKEFRVGNNITLHGSVNINQVVVTEPNSDTNKQKKKFVLTIRLRNVLISGLVVVFITVLVIVVRLFLVPVKDNVQIKQPEGDDNNTIAKFVKRQDWLAQPPSGVLDPLKLPAELVIITHTATQDCQTHQQCILQARLLQTFHIESRKFFDIGYNFMVGGDGYIYEGRGWNLVGSHTFGYNIRSIGIAFIGTFIQIRPPERQLTAAKLVIQEGVKLGKLSEQYKLLAHTNVSSTLSPGLMLFQELRTWPHFTETPN